MSNAAPANDVLATLLITLLVPLFLPGAAGDNALAQAAATRALAACQKETGADPITAAQIIAFDLAALGALSRAAAPDLSVAEHTRLRASAASCQRAAQRCRRTLLPAANTNANPSPRRTQSAAPRPTTERVDPATASRWALAAAAAARDLTASLPGLPAADRPSLEQQLATLTSCVGAFQTHANQASPVP